VTAQGRARTPRRGDPPRRRRRARRGRVDRRRSPRERSPPPRARPPGAAGAAEKILARLEREYPDARCALDHHDPLELLVATILSAQCTDERVNKVTPVSSRAVPRRPTTPRSDPRARGADPVDRLLPQQGALAPGAGAGPRRAPRRAGAGGHGRAHGATRRRQKTANVVLGNAFGLNEGSSSTPTSARLATRLGLTKETIRSRPSAT